VHAVALNWTGQHTRSLADKHRCPIPAEWRNAGPGLGITDYMLAPSPLLDCLRLYPMPVWEEILEKARKEADSAVVSLFFRRAVLGNAYRTKVDNAGRITVPTSLQALVGIQGELVLAGQLRFVEIWSVTGWMEELRKLREAAPDYLGRLAEMGL